MLSVVMLSVMMLSVVMLSVMMMSVMLWQSSSILQQLLFGCLTYLHCNDKDGSACVFYDSHQATLIICNDHTCASNMLAYAYLLGCGA